ncbi:hypothetical protein ATL17_2075 [Maritalea mobilis]|uniref:Uncharacterized protein n=1 Tax=Maritalea mobilis TaxID=483324 RepID=A0A4V3DAW4_9HYPH|nr:hypothetical protein ATL17_2075 [Maritalea mobilis]
MTTSAFHINLPKIEFKIQELTALHEIDFHKLGAKLRISLENLQILVQSTKINFIQDREGSYDL